MCFYNFAVQTNGYFTMIQLARSTSIFMLIVIIQSCAAIGGLPDGEEYAYQVGEVVYYKTDHQPMLIQKQLYKKKKKQYEVVFKNEEGELLYNTVLEDELIGAPPENKARI